MSDLYIKNGWIIDGSGREGFSADVFVSGGRIVKILKEKNMPIPEGTTVIDASGKTVCPGFIDIHSHSDWSPLKFRDYSSKALQGVTTELVGNCGSSPMPFSPAREERYEFSSVRAYREALNRKGILNDFAVLVGHGTLRQAVMGFTNRRPELAELEKMKELLRKMLLEGARGMSLGLIYPPSAFSERAELLELSKVLCEENALLTVHMRNEGPRIFEAVSEVLSIARESGVQLQISHLKLMGRSQWGRAAELTALLEAARAEGVRVYADQYPYTASNTTLTALVPKEYHDGGRSALLKRLEAPTPELLTGINTLIRERGGAETILIVSAGGHAAYKNRYLSDLSADFRLGEAETAVKILLDTDAGANATYCCIDRADMLHIMEKDYIAVGSDGTASPFGTENEDSAAHPRYFGTFPAFLQTVREENLMCTEAAVRKCTGLPAEILGFEDRGLLSEGKRADLVIFDPETIGSEATFMKPAVRPEGISHVILGGEIICENGRVTAKRAGRVL